MSEAGPVAEYLGDSAVFRWRNQTFLSDLVFTVPVALCLAVGLSAGHPAAGMIAAGGAMTVGFGSKQSIDRSRLLPMLFATAGIAFSTLIGMIAGHDGFVLVVVAALWAFGYGMLTSRPGGYGWVGQQCVITLLVGSAFPASASMAAARTGLLAAGGIIQILWSAAALREMSQLRDHLLDLSRYLAEEELALRAAVTRTAWTVRRGRLRGSTLSYALRLMVTVGIATEVYRRLHFSSGYWVPMTALVVLKPSVADTVNRSVARTLGTIAGAGLLSLLLARFTLNPVEIAMLVAVFAWLSYATLNVNYAMYAVFLTGYIVFLLSLARIPGVETAERRAVATAIGGAIALTIRLVVLRSRRAGRNARQTGV